MTEEKCKTCGETPVYIDQLCDGCYQLRLMDYAVSKGKKVITTYDGKKFYD